MQGGPRNLFDELLQVKHRIFWHLGDIRKGKAVKFSKKEFATVVYRFLDACHAPQPQCQP